MASKNTPAIIEPASTSLAVTQADLPGLYEAVDADERLVPSVYLLQALSQITQNVDGAKSGDVVLALGTGDPDPVWLIGGPDKRTHFDAFILRRVKSYARFSGTEMDWLTRAEFDAARDMGDRDVWNVYRFIIGIPEIDDLTPARIMLTRTGGTKTARQINTYIDRAVRAGQLDPICVRFTSVEEFGRQSKQKYYALKAALVAGSPEGLAAARDMQAYSLNMAQENAAPAIADDAPGF